MDINIKNQFEDARPRITEVAIPITIPTILIYWKNVSRFALILFAALTPIFFLPFTSLPVAVHKEIFVFTLILISFFAILGSILLEGRIRYPGHWLMTSLIFLVLVWGASAFFSVNQIGSLIGAWGAPDSFMAILLFVLLSLSIVMTLDRRDIAISLLVFLASLAILGIFELLQLAKIFILPLDITKNVNFNPIGSVNDLGVLLAFGLVIASGLMSSNDITKILKRLLGVVAIIFLLNIIIIDFWAIWAGLAFAMIFMICFLSAGLKSELGTRNLELSPSSNDQALSSEYSGLQLAYFQKAWLPSAILLLSLIFLFIPSPIVRFIQTPAEVSPSFRATLDTGIANLKAGHYLVGSGPNTFSYAFNLYKPVGINQTIFWQTVFTRGASAVTSWLSTVGILGVSAILFLIFAVVFTGIIGTSLRNASRGFMNVASQAIFVGITYLFIMWFLYGVNFTIMAFAFWGIGLFLAASLFFIKETNVGSSVSNKSVFKEFLIFTSPQKTFLFSLLIVGIMVSMAVGVYFEVNRYVAEVYFGASVVASGGGDNEATLSNLLKATEFWKYDERYFQNLAQATFFQLNALLSDKNISQANLMAQFQNITTNSIAFAQKAGSLNPQNPFNVALLGNIYENLISFTGGASDFALSSYGKAVSLDPKNPVHYLALGRVYIARANLAIKSNAQEDVSANLEHAVSNLLKAIELKQDYAPVRFLLVQIYDRQGKLPEAVKRAEELVILNNVDVGALFQLGFLYYKVGRYDDSKVVFERTVELSSNYSNARYFLGLIYDRTTEDRNKAIEEFRKIAELNPDNAEVKQILANLKAGKAALFGITPPAPAPQ
ncbi:MAG: hypothetical protein AAB648_02050, partial [Patescibacteria group bacterium]